MTKIDKCRYAYITSLGTLPELIAEITKYVDKQKVMIDLDTNEGPYGSERFRIEITYYEPETDMEYERRKRLEQETNLREKQKALEALQIEEQHFRSYLARHSLETVPIKTKEPK